MAMSLRLFDGFIILYFWLYLSLFVTDYSFLFSALNKKFALPFQAISHIGGPTVILSLLLAARYLADKETFYRSPLINKLNRLLGFSEKKIIFFVFLALFFILALLSVARHLALSSGASDLGIFDQAVWNTAQGDILFSSLKGNMNLLGDHFEPVLLLVAPLYRLWPDCMVLFIVQSLLLASALLPLYLIIKQKLSQRLIIFAFFLSYLLSRPLRGVGLSDFHPECFILPLLFWAYYFLITKRNAFLFISLFSLLLCKEDTSFLISGLGVFTCFFQKRFRLGVGLFVAGILSWFLLTAVIIPHFNSLHTYAYMDKITFGLNSGHSIRSIVGLIFNKEKIIYIIKLLVPVGLLPLFSPAHYILIATPLLKNFIPASTISCGWYKISSHYTASIIPFVYISAVYGAGWLIAKLRNKKAPVFLGLFIIFSSLLAYGKTDANKLGRFLATIKDKQTLEKLSYLKVVPDNASVAANFNLVPHLAHRKYIYEWQAGSLPTDFIAEYIVIDMGLLDYLPGESISKIESYLGQIKKMGYSQVFSNTARAFFIFHNPGIDKSLVEKAGLTQGGCL